MTRALNALRMQTLALRSAFGKLFGQPGAAGGLPLLAQGFRSAYGSFLRFSARTGPILKGGEGSNSDHDPECAAGRQAFNFGRLCNGFAIAAPAPGSFRAIVASLCGTRGEQLRP